MKRIDPRAFHLLAAFSCAMASATWAQSGSSLKTVFFDCSLPEGQVSCATLASDFFNFFSPNRGFAQAPLNAKEADFRVSLRVALLNQHFRYRIGVESTAGSCQLENTEILRSKDANTATQTVLEDVKKCLGVLLEVQEAAQWEGQKLVFRTYPKDAPVREDSGSDPNRGWAFSGNLSGNFTSGTVSSASGQLGGTLNFTSPEWRFSASASVSYNYLRIETPDGRLDEAQVVSFGGRVLILRSFLKHWSIAAVVTPARSPQRNLDFSNNAGLAFAWDLVPIMTTIDRNIGVRYTVENILHRYSKVTLDGVMDRVFFEHALEAYIRWNLGWFDVTASGSARSKIDDVRYSQVGADLSCEFRFTPEISLNLWGNIGYRFGLINAPAPDTGVTPGQQLILGFNSAPVVASTGLQLTFTPGRADLMRNDVRGR